MFRFLSITCMQLKALKIPLGLKVENIYTVRCMPSHIVLDQTKIVKNTVDLTWKPTFDWTW